MAIARAICCAAFLWSLAFAAAWLSQLKRYRIPR